MRSTPCSTAGARAADARPGHEQDHGRIAGYAYAVSFRVRRGALRFPCRSHWAQAGADGEHPDLFGVLLCIRAGKQHCHAGGGAVCSGSGHGRRMEYWRDAGGRDLAGGVSGQGNFRGAEFVGFGLCRSGVGGGASRTVFWMARRVLCRDSAGLADVVDSARSTGVGNVAQRGSLGGEGDSTGYAAAKFSVLFRPPYLKPTFALLLFNFSCLFAWWGLFQWIPPYLSLPVSQGGRGFGVMGTTTLLVVLNLFGMFPGYLSFGWVADYVGRRNAFIGYSLAAALLIPLYAAARSPVALMTLGTLVAFFGTGLFSGSGIIGSEIFPTGVRARALGFTYNGARAMSSVAPLVIGRVGQVKGLGWAFYLCAAGYLLAALMTTQLPETRGKKLE